MILVYGNAKVGQGISSLLSAVGVKNTVVDYTEYHENLCHEAIYIIASPGIPPTHDIYTYHKQKVMSELTFLGAWKQGIFHDASLSSSHSSSIEPSIPQLPVRPFDIITIGITGTKGKSSSTHLTAGLLAAISPYEVIAVGNLGLPPSQTLADIFKNKKTDQKYVFVIECSSFMLWELQYFVFDFSLWTNLSPDHLNRHTDMGDYAHAKANLVRHTSQISFVPLELQQYCTEKEKAVQTSQDQDTTDTTIQEPQTTIEAEKTGIDTTKIQFVGTHHMTNIAMVRDLVGSICSHYGRNAEENKAVILMGKLHNALYAIQPLPHRLHKIATHNDIAWIDDGYATNSLSQGQALQSFESVILIAGGSDKGEDYTHLGDVYKKHIRIVICLGEIAPKLEKVALYAGVDSVFVLSLQDAVKQAGFFAHKYGIKTVLFAPGAASFDMFDNAAQRSEIYIEAVQNYISKT